MDLTPIKIRGKKRPAVNQRVSSKASVNALPGPILPATGISLPSSTPASIAPSAKARRLSPRPPRAQGQRALSSLECLPTELLDEIFLHCININLPQCSPILGQKLASNRIKNLFLLKTCSVGKDELYFENTRDLASFQSRVLDLRWMTLPFLRRCNAEYMIQALVKELSARKFHWLGGPTVVTRETEPTIRAYIKASFPSEAKDTKPYYEVHWKETNPSRHIILCFGPLDGVVGLNIINEVSSFNPSDDISKEQRKSYKWRILHFEPGCRIPNKLLHGPWTDEKCDFLDIVIRGNASIDWDHTTSGEIAHEGFMEALRTRNFRAVKTLLVRKHPEALPGERKDFFEREEFVNSNVGIVPETRHLSFAIIQLDCQTDIVEALLYAPESKIDARDDEIWDWVHKRKFYEDPRAAWLEKRLVWLREKQDAQRLAIPVTEKNAWFFPQTRV